MCLSTTCSKKPMPPDVKLSETMKKNYAGLQETDLRNVYVVVCMHSLKARTRGITASEVKDVLQRRGYTARNVADSLKKLETRQLIVSVQEKQARYYFPKELSRASDAVSSSLAGRFSDDELSKLSALVYKAVGRAPVVFDDICKAIQKNEVGTLTPEEVRIIVGANNRRVIVDIQIISHTKTKPWKNKPDCQDCLKESFY
ncbi:Hypothetical protein DHA2_151411 [Giardia duodenalis]|uniref:Uncharacterized protein n=1 Tax=Giardia intestinalis TaxID=5741 RepID=V6TAF1_GIAIN|nr:Hypothetical protein DHA2_151411 [Giardia intestinalis]